MRDSSLLSDARTDGAAKTGAALLNSGDKPSQPMKGWLLALLACAAFFAATAPTLHRLDFFDGVEHINLATVLELRRDGGPAQWLMPQLERDPRTVKPPLTAWIAAAPVRTDTVRDLASPDPAVRSAAFDQFIWECRWPTLLCTCLLLLGVYELGRIVGGQGRSGDWKIGLLSLAVCASCLLLLRQGRRATTDLQLALWVTIANAFLAKMMIERRRWLGGLGAGFTLGLAIMSKGPHIALLQTVVPAALFACYFRFYRRPMVEDRVPLAGSGQAERRRGFAMPLVIGAVLALAIGLWWYAYVLQTVPGVWHTWFHEVTRIDANTMKPDPWYQYVIFMLRFLMPWTAWVLLGAGYAIYELLSKPRRATATSGPTSSSTGNPNIVFALLLLLVPFLVMSCFHERKERYLTPMAGPAAVLAAYAISLYFRAGRQAPLLPRIVDAVTWLMIAALAVGIPALGGTHNKSFLRFDATPWFTPAVAATTAGLAAALLIIGFALSRRWTSAGVIAIVLAAWLGNEMQLRGYIAADADEDGRSERLLAERLWKDYPDAIVYDTEPPTKYGNLSLPDIVLSLYCDRVVQLRPASLPAEPGDRPLVLLSEAPEHNPPAVPKGWQRVDVLPLRTGKQYVDVLWH